MTFRSCAVKTGLSIALSAVMAVSMMPAAAVSAFADDAANQTTGEGTPNADDGGSTGSDTADDTADGSGTSSGSTDGTGATDGTVEDGDDGSGSTDPEPAATYTVSYEDGVSGKVFDTQTTEGLTYGVKTPAFSGTPKRAGYTFMGWSPKVAKKVKASVVYKATWKKNVPSADKVVPYLTVKAKYKGGKLSTIKKDVKPGNKVSTSNTGSGKYLVSLSFSVDQGSQLLDPSFSSKYTMGIKYRVLVKDKWSAWVSNGQTTGGNSRIQAFQVKLTGKLAKYYTIYSRAQMRYTGWMDWSQGGKCGIAGYNFRDMTGLQLVIKKVGKKAPGSTTLSYFSGSKTKMSYTLSTTSGSSTAKKLGDTAGSTSGSAASGVSLSITHKGLSGDVRYSVNQKGSWSSTVSKGYAGSTSKSKTMRAVKISLTGSLKKYYDVYYRVRVKGYGKWLGWAKNGAAAGSTAYDLPIRALQVQLVLKSASAPGSTSNSYCSQGGFLADIAYKQILQNKANSLSSDTQYLLVVDTNTCRVGIFKGSKGNWKMIKYWLAGVGAYGKDTETKKGTFKICGKEYVFGSDKGYNCWYATQFYGNYLFHSEVYDIGHKDAAHMQSGGLGTHVSHGCVRLAIKNAKWLYERYSSFYGSTVKVY